MSTVLRNLGIENVALGFLAGFTGRALDQGLRDTGIRTDFIWLEEGLTRVNVKIKAGQETEINGAGPVIPAAALEELFAKLDCLRSGDVLVLAGSIPVSLPDDIYQRILARLADREILTAVDATRDLLRAVLPYRPFLIKPNRSELGELFGRTPLMTKRLRTAPAASRRRGPGTCWCPWRETVLCCWTKPAGSTGWAFPRARCATPWARETPWWPVSWPAGWSTGTTPWPIAWGRLPAQPQPSLKDWPQGTRFWR